jgi:hypothetical protein
MCRQAPSGDAAPEVAWCIPVRTRGLRAEPQVPAAAAPDMASRPDGPAATAGPLRTCEIPAGRARYQIPRGPRTAYRS